MTYSIGKPNAEDISAKVVRFPWEPASMSTDWLSDVVGLEGAKWSWESRPEGGRNFLIVPVRPDDSLQDVAARAQRIVANVNAWVDRTSPNAWRH